MYQALYYQQYNADLPLMSSLSQHHVLHNQNSKRLPVEQNQAIELEVLE